MEITAYVEECTDRDWWQPSTADIADALPREAWFASLAALLIGYPDDTVIALRAVTPDGDVIAEVPRTGVLRLAYTDEDLPEWAATLGTATPEQCVASGRAPGGIIPITEGGAVATGSWWAAQDDETVKVWVEWD